MAPTRPPVIPPKAMVGIDHEGHDPHLHQRGPGGIRRDGHVAGFSIAHEHMALYAPLRHLGGDNVEDPGLWVEWLRDLGEREDITWVGANIGFDIEWLETIGVSLRGKLIDVQLVEALIDEEQESYALEALATKYLGQGKDESLLRRAAIENGLDPKRDMWKLPARYVGPYAEFDAKSVLQIFDEQLKVLQAECLEEIFTLEMNLIPLIWAMRKQGIPMDLDAASALSAELKGEEGDLRYQCWQKHKMRLNVTGSDPDPAWSGPILAKMCEQLDISYPMTPRGNPSFEGDWLASHDHPFLKAVADIRELNRIRTTFIDEWIFGNEIKGRIHPQWKQLKMDDGGTRTGRMAASNPNPQQVPGRSDLGAKVRRLFRAPAPLKWAKIDYSQQEPRLAVHYAAKLKLASAEMVKLAYRNNPKMDIYQFLAEAAQISRREAKDLTLGRFYGMGVTKLSQKLGLSQNDAKALLDKFDNYVPFVRELSNTCSTLAQSRGWIRTICGRRRHFNWWEPANREEAHDARPVRPKSLAEQKWPRQRVRRAFTHKSLNSLIQGSAADMTKSAMLLIWRETDLVPYMQVHDELNYGVRDESEAKQVKELAEHCVEMEVPIVADLSLGEAWK